MAAEAAGLPETAAQLYSAREVTDAESARTAHWVARAARDTARTAAARATTAADAFEAAARAADAAADAADNVVRAAVCLDRARSLGKGRKTDSAIEQAHAATSDAGACAARAVRSARSAAYFGPFPGPGNADIVWVQAAQLLRRMLARTTEPVTTESPAKEPVPVAIS
jgi:hypothetical protein